MEIEINDESGEEKKCKVLTISEYNNIKYIIEKYENITKKEWKEEFKNIDDEDNKIEFKIDYHHSNYFNLSILTLLFILF